MSIRLRLTLLYTTILMLTLSVFGVALYTIQSQNIVTSLKKDLKASSESIRIALRVSPQDGVPSLSQQVQEFAEPLLQATPQSSGQDPAQNTAGQNAEVPPPIPPEDLSESQVFKRLREREIVRILDGTGLMIASPLGGEEEALPLSQEGLETLQTHQSWWQTGTVNDERYLIYNSPVIVDGELYYIIQVARSLKETDNSLAGLSRTLIASILITVVVAFGIGWVISGYTLRPIHRITQTARMIGNESDFSKRVVYTGPNDEVGQLAITFNSMLTRLQDAYQKVSHALSMQRDFVADVSHELRTPLTTVRGNLELLLLREPPLPDEEKEDILTDIVEESDRLIRLVNDLLLLARADSRQSTTREQIPLPALIDETVRQARRIDPQREIILDVQDVTAMGDRDALKQVILILIDNALKHSQAKITVSAGVADSQVLICVRDEGPGMTQETLNHVFERFHRGEDRTVPGFGLGLPIAKALVEGQDGSITIQSQPGKGCTVQVFLPAHLTT